MDIELTFLTGVAFRGQDVTAPRLRALLALLADDLGRGATVGRLVTGLWPDDQPENPTKAVQILVSRARALLGPDVIASTPTGYRLTLTEDQVDTAAVLTHAAVSAKHLRHGDHAAAITAADAGLALFDGAHDNETVIGDPVAELQADRAVTHESLVRTRVLALARSGHSAEALDQLRDLVAARPRDEELLLELMRCEAATVGPSAALERYDTYRRDLRDDLGTDPGPDLQALHQRLLEGDRPVVRHGVEHEPNELLGRDNDLAAVSALLRGSRITSIIGPGGLGKTRLAHAVSRRSDHRTVHFVQLAGVTTDADVVSEVASAVGVRPGPGVPIDQAAAIAVTLGSALVVLDNCEHVVQGVADLARTLVSMTKELRILTTSRAPLGLSSESVYHLPELPLPVTVELFTQRARAARPGADLPSDVVTDLCRHLDGLPLAVELAAARVRTMSVADIARRLDDRFALLRGGSRDAPPRHRTLHAVVEWSWNLLDPAEQAAMRSLAVFPAGFTMQAAEHVVPDALDTVEHLVDQSLLRVVDTPTGTRITMLETVRAFCGAGDHEDAVLAFLGWARAYGADRYEVVFGPDAFTDVGAIQAEQDNLLYALRLALDRRDLPTVAAVTAVLAGMWLMLGDYVRLVSLVNDTAWTLSHYRPEPDDVEVARAAASLSAGAMYLLQGPRKAIRSLVALRRLPPAPADSIARAGSIVLLAGSEEDLLELCDSDVPAVAGAACAMASYLWQKRLDKEKAIAAAERMLTVFERESAPWLRVLAHSMVAEQSLHLERGADAKAHLETALGMLGPGTDPLGMQSGMVLASLQLGDVDAADRWLATAVRCESEESYGTRTFHLCARAEIELARGNVDEGLRLWRRADRTKFTETWVYTFEPLAFDPWMLQIEATTVIAHANHGRLDLVPDLVDGMPDKLTTLLTGPVAELPPTVVELPICGVMLLAVGLADIAAGDTATGVRLIALAQRLRFLREFHPTMASARFQRVAMDANRSAYEDAVSSYADLSPEEVRAAAVAVLRGRDQH